MFMYGCELGMYMQLQATYIYIYIYAHVCTYLLHLLYLAYVGREELKIHPYT